MANFVEMFPEKGFDSMGGPHNGAYQMVPVGGTRYVRLVDGENMTIAVDQPEVCDVIPTDSAFRRRVADQGSPNTSRPERNVSQGGDQYFKLIGRSPGKCTIKASVGSKALDAYLTAAVKKRRQSRIAFTICSDAGDHVARINSEAEIVRYFQFARNLWLDQANVEFFNQGIQRKSVDQNLGDTIWINRDGDPGAGAIADLGADGVDVNVFFVWHVQVDGEVDKTEAITSESGDVIIYGARKVAYYGNTLAHELGHHLGISGHADHLPKHLMYENSRGAATRLTSIDIDTVNR